MTNNEKIARFMGFTIGKLSGWMSGTIEIPYSYIKVNGEITKPVRIDKLKFHTSWDWLMPVVEKIESLGFRSSINYSTAGNIHGANIYGRDFDSRNITGKNKIECTLKAVVEFIEWYEKDNSKQ